MARLFAREAGRDLSMRIPSIRSKKFFLALACAILVLLVLLSAAAVLLNKPPRTDQTLGVTFSTMYARQLGLDPKETYSAILGDLGVRAVRLPVYWDEIEREKDVYDWELLDWMIDQSQQNDAQVTLVIGQKVPRWPECFIPDWAEKMSFAHAEVELIEFMEQVVVRYRESPAIIRWQIENEALFPFGVCPPPDPGRLEREVELVRSLDTRPIQLTVSGEIEPYVDAAALADILGISMYRVTWNKYFGYMYYPITPGFYRAKAAVAEPLVDKIIITELQTEPWFHEPIEQSPLSEWYELFDEKDLKRNVDFARRTGFDEVYAWGVEWWYFLKQNGEPRLWETARELFDDML